MIFGNRACVCVCSFKSSMRPSESRPLHFSSLWELSRVERRDMETGKRREREIMKEGHQPAAASLCYQQQKHTGRMHTPLQCRVRKPLSGFLSEENIRSSGISTFSCFEQGFLNCFVPPTDSKSASRGCGISNRRVDSQIGNNMAFSFLSEPHNNAAVFLSSVIFPCCARKR